MDSIRVEYSRKVSPAQYETVSIGGALEFKPTSEDIQKEFDQNLLVLKLMVDAQLAQQTPASGGSFDDGYPDMPPAPAPASGSRDEPDLGPEPGWAKDMREETEAKQAAVVNNTAVTPPPAPAPQPAPAPAPAAQAAQPVQSAPAGADKDKVYLGRAKVFRTNIKQASTGLKYAELRVGHDDLTAHINDQYVTVKVYEPSFTAVVGSLVRMKNEDTGEIKDMEQMNIVAEDFVDIWGKFKPWRSDPTKFDLVAQAIQKSQ